jgi:branched-subunit amino acid ABC-type transport system permease component
LRDIAIFASVEDTAERYGDTMAQAVWNGLCSGAQVALLALGFGLVLRTTKVFHVGIASSYTVAGYVYYLFGPPRHTGQGAALYLASLAAALAIGVLFEVGLYAPLHRGLRRPSSGDGGLLLVSFAGNMIVINALALAFGNQVRITSGDLQRVYRLFAITTAESQLAQLLTCMVGAAALAFFLVKTRVGLLLRALASDAGLLGIHGYESSRLRLVSMSIGSALAGCAGLLRTIDVGVSPRVGFEAFTVAASAVLLAGNRSILTPIVGALLFGVALHVLAFVTSLRWGSTFALALLIISILARPQGLLIATTRPTDL